MTRLHLGIAALLFALPVAAQAQTLADVARAEAERRKAITAPSKTITNADLRPDFTRPTNATPPAPTPSAQVPSVNLPGGKVEAEEPAKDQAYWSARINAARQALDRSKIFADALQSRINALTNDFAARDDPAQRRQIELERQRALAELERVKKEVTEQTKAISDIEEEARKAGVPPGWLR